MMKLPFCILPAEEIVSLDYFPDRKKSTKSMSESVMAVILREEGHTNSQHVGGMNADR